MLACSPGRTFARMKSCPRMSRLEKPTFRGPGVRQRWRGGSTLLGHCQDLDASDPVRLLAAIFGVAEQERARPIERTKPGLERARRQGQAPWASARFRLPRGLKRQPRCVNRLNIHGGTDSSPAGAPCTSSSSTQRRPPTWCCPETARTQERLRLGAAKTRHGRRTSPGRRRDPLRPR